MFRGKKRSLKEKLYIEIILLMALLFGIASIVCLYLLYKVTDQHADEQVHSITANIAHAIETQDITHLALEGIAHSYLIEAMSVFQIEYLSANGDPSKIDLQALKQSFNPVFDYYLIDNQNVVVFTTFLPDRGLSLSAFPNVQRFLEHVRVTGQVESERAMNTVNGGMKKFVYQVTPDKKYILEIGIPLNECKAMVPNLSIDYFDFPIYVSKILKQSNIVQSISIYDWSGKPYYSSKSQTEEELSGKKKEILSSITTPGGSSKLFQDDTLYYYEKIYLPGQNPHGYAGKIIEVAIDLKLLRAPIKNAVITYGLIVLFILIIAFIMASRFAHRITLPVEQLTYSANQIAQGNVNYPVAVTGNINELSLLSDSVDSMRLQLQTQIRELNQYNDKLTQSYQQIIKAFFRALEHRERYTAEHSLQVNKLSLSIGEEMKLTEEEMQHLDWGSLLHDIGKLSIADTILLKPCDLSPNEYEQIKAHPFIGFQMLPDSDLFKPVADIILYHHERFDGLGYPQGLTGSQIPLLARICCVADAVHAILSDRPYRKGRSWEEALNEIARCSNKQFDPEVVSALMRMHQKKY